MLIKVVFPAPLCPKIPIHSLGSIYKVNFLSAWTFCLENNVVKVLDKFFILNPKAGALALDRLLTLFLYLTADYSSS